MEAVVLAIAWESVERACPSRARAVEAAGYRAPYATVVAAVALATTPGTRAATWASPGVTGGRMLVPPASSTVVVWRVQATRRSLLADHTDCPPRWWPT